VLRIGAYLTVNLGQKNNILRNTYVEMELTLAFSEVGRNRSATKLVFLAYFVIV
jgi:hypothetical protein